MVKIQITPAFVSLGSNLGDLEGNLSKARIALAGLDRIRLGPCSPVYFTDPQDVQNQPWFANQVARLDCGPAWTPLDLLRRLLEIEDQMGRTRERAKGPRIIDLDLLLFGAQHHKTLELTLPHPRIRQRAFVLVPLRDIAPELTFTDGTTISEALGLLTFQLKGRNIQQQFPFPTIS